MDPDIVRFLLSGVCHQLPEHSLAIAGRVLPLCARCTGTFLGIPAGLLTLWAAGQGRRSGLPRGRVWLALSLPVLAWALDGLNSLAGEVLGRAWLYGPSNVLRLITGTGLGVVLSALLYPTFYHALGRGAADGPILHRTRYVASLLFAGAALVIMLLAASTIPAPPSDATLTAAAAMLATVAVFTATVGVLALVNGVLIILILGKEGTADTCLSAAPYVAAGLTAGIVEMGALALLRQLILG